MDVQLDGKTTLVTGGSGGIGRAIIRELAHHGSDLAVGYHTNEGSAQEAAAEVRETGQKAVAVRADVSEPEDVDHLFDRVETTLGPIDVLVNNAGVARGGAIGDLDDEEIDHVLGVNLQGVFHTCRAAAGRLTEGGRVINLSTGLTNQPEAGFGLYAASKAGVETLTRSLAAELGPRDITANVVQPGPTEPGMFKARSGAAHGRRVSDSYFGRIGRAEEIARVVAFLASSASGWVSGEVICVDGGIMS